MLKLVSNSTLTFFVFLLFSLSFMSFEILPLEGLILVKTFLDSLLFVEFIGLVLVAFAIFPDIDDTLVKF